MKWNLQLYQQYVIDREVINSNSYYISSSIYCYFVYDTKYVDYYRFIKFGKGPDRYS